MKRVCTMVLLLGLAVMLADCSKCNGPFWATRACHNDTSSAQ
jgi:hypothetical protein